MTSEFAEEWRKHQNRMDTINETGLMSCNYCDAMVDVSDCSVYPEMIEKIVTGHVRREHPDKCMSEEEAHEIIEEQRKIDKDKYIP